MECSVVEYTLDYTFFDCPKSSSDYICLIVLNQPFKLSLFQMLYELADYKIYADGGSNFVKKIVGEEALSKYKPDLIIGDFDSIEKEAEKSMLELGIKFLRKPDEDHTDSEKALIFLEEEIIPKVVDKSIRVIVLGAFGGRMDHTMYNIHLLWKKIKDGPMKYNLFMLNNGNLMTGIAKGHTIIKIPKKFTPANGCGVIPIGKCEHIKTKGLKYDMGKLIYNV